MNAMPFRCPLQFLLSAGVAVIAVLATGGHGDVVRAEALASKIAQVSLPPVNITPNLRPEGPLPAEPLPQLPPIDELLGNFEETNPLLDASRDNDEAFFVSGVQLAGSKVFSAEDFADLFAEYTGRPVTFSELQQLRSAITQHYVDAGFLTSRAFIPPQTLDDGIVTVQVIEGI